MLKIFQYLGEKAFSFQQGQRYSVVAIEVKEIKNVITKCALSNCGIVILQFLKIGRSVFIHDYYLSIQDTIVRKVLQILGDSCEFSII